MCAAARSTPWPLREGRSGLPVLDRDDLGTEPTLRAEFSFGQATLPVPRTTPVPPAPVHYGGVVKAFPRTPTPTPAPYPRRPSPTPMSSALLTLPTPMIAPPPSAKRALAIGFTIGTSLGLAILGAAWHFFL
jgi:hypothetical protein